MPHSADGNMVEDLIQFDLQREIADAEAKKPWPSGIYSRTLFKKPDFRTVLVLMKPGARMDEHHTDGTHSVQVLKGGIQFRTQGESHALRAGTLLMLGASIPHEVESQEDSAFLLTIGWPSNEELLEMPHRGYGT